MSSASKTSLSLFAFVGFLLAPCILSAGDAAKGPIKVFILAGQSNMEGPANINTFDYIGDDPTKRGSR